MQDLFWQINKKWFRDTTYSWKFISIFVSTQTLYLWRLRVTMFNLGCIEFSIYFHVTNFWFKKSTILLLINLVPNFSYHILRCVQCSISTYISLDWIRCHIFICLYKTFFKCSDACQMCFFMTRRQMGLWYENHLSSHGWHMRRGTRLKKVKQLQQDGFQYHLVALTEEGAAAKFAKDWCKKNIFMSIQTVYHQVVTI